MNELAKHNMEIQRKAIEEQQGLVDKHQTRLDILKGATVNSFCQTLTESGLRLVLIDGENFHTTLTVKSFRDMESVLKRMDSILNIDEDEEWQTIPCPESKEITYYIHTLEKFTLFIRAKLEDKSTCRLEVTGTRKEYKWVEIEAEVPIYRIVCPE